MTLAAALASLMVATVLWHVGDVYMLREIAAGRWREGAWWVCLQFASVPLFAYSSLAFYRIEQAWWIVELPYMLMGVLVSALLFRSVLGVQITWREIVAAALIVSAIGVIASRPTDDRPSSAVSRR